LPELDRTIHEIGTLLGLEARADSIVARLSQVLADVRAAVRGRDRPRVLYVIGLDPPVAAGPGTFVQEMIEAAGGDNVMEDSPVRWPQVSLEHVLAVSAQVLIMATERPRAELLAELRRRAGWRDLDAVRHGRVEVVDADLFNRPGPSLIGAVAALAHLLHPDAFADSGAAAFAAGSARESGR
ncbi:MAG: ABC transporter substrate-binding protein, partial [Gemmatimonadota bacterium]